MSKPEGLPLAPRPGLLWAWAILQTLATAALMTWLCFRPGLFDLYYPPLVSRAHAADAGKIVRWLDSREPSLRLNSHLKNGVLRSKEISHFEDVRRLLRRGRWIMAGAWASLAVLALATRFKASEFRAAQQRVFLLIGLLLGVGILLAAWDWRVLFAWLHQPFFGSTSWRMPRGAYSLALYPERFWQIMSFSVVGGSLLAALAAWFLARRRSSPGGSLSQGG